MKTAITVLGLGAMGRALAARFAESGHPTTGWNRTAGRAEGLAGVRTATTAADAIADADLTVVCLLDHGSVHDVCDPIADRLTGRAVLNLTSTTPNQARELADWADRHGVDYLDGAILAVPAMIGGAGSRLLYSGSRTVFDRFAAELRLLGSADHRGDDAGAASLLDFALLSGMYSMFGGFYHGAAMAATGGVSATEFARLASDWLRAMTNSLAGHAAAIDAGDYTDPVQDLWFTKSAVDAIAAASREAGVAQDTIAPIRNLIDRQIAGGHGSSDTVRIYESLAADTVSTR